MYFSYFKVLLYVEQGVNFTYCNQAYVLKIEK